MNSPPSLALIEFTTTPAGVVAMDKLIKKAPIASIRSGTISPGRFLVLFNGTTASVKESYDEGLGVSEGRVWDHVFLPHAHPQLNKAVFGERHSTTGGSLFILESSSTCSVVQAIDLCLKGTDVTLIEMRLSDPLLQGKGLAFLEGPLQEVQAAVDVTNQLFNTRAFPENHTHVFELNIIPSPHEGVRRQITHTTHFSQAKALDLEGENLP